jgi:hypothetical protein
MAPLPGLKGEINAWHWHFQIEFNDISNACNRLPFVCFKHVFREKNHVANYLTKQEVLN